MSLVQTLTIVDGPKTSSNFEKACGFMPIFASNWNPIRSVFTTAATAAETIIAIHSYQNKQKVEWA